MTVCLYLVRSSIERVQQLCFSLSLEISCAYPPSHVRRQQAGPRYCWDTSRVAVCISYYRTGYTALCESLYRYIKDFRKHRGDSFVQASVRHVPPPSLQRGFPFSIYVTNKGSFIYYVTPEGGGVMVLDSSLLSKLFGPCFPPQTPPPNSLSNKFFAINQNCQDFRGKRLPKNPDRLPELSGNRNIGVKTEILSSP